MKNLIVLLCLLFCLLGCKTVKYVPVEKVVETKVEVKEIIRDTMVYIGTDHAMARALLECDSAGNVLIKRLETVQGKLNAKADIRIQDNELVAECTCDSLAIYLTLKERYEKISVNTEGTKVQIIEKKLQWWQTSLMWFGAICLFGLIAFIILKIK